MLLIFDFDGTIVDSLPLVYNDLSSYIEQTNLSYSDLRNLSSRDVLKALKIPKKDIPKLILKIRNNFKLKISEQPIVPGIKDAFVQLKKLNHSIHIVSSNSKDNIETFLKNHNIKNNITTITGTFSLFGKAHIIKKIMAKNKYDFKNSIYIGDETRDINAAKKSGCISGSVGWGYNSIDVLKKNNPDFLVNSPNELVNKIHYLENKQARIVN